MRIRFFLKSNERVQLFWHQITSNFNKLFPFQTFNISEKHAFLPYLFSIINNVQDGAIWIWFPYSLLILNWLIETTDFYAYVFVRWCLLFLFHWILLLFDRISNYHCTIYQLISPCIVFLWCYCCEAYIQNNSFWKKEIKTFFKTLQKSFSLPTKNTSTYASQMWYSLICFYCNRTIQSHEHIPESFYEYLF